MTTFKLPNSLATVCRAVRVLANSSLFYKERCRKVSRAFSCNPYFTVASGLDFFPPS